MKKIQNSPTLFIAFFFLAFHQVYSHIYTYNTTYDIQCSEVMGGCALSDLSIWNDGNETTLPGENDQVVISSLSSFNSSILIRINSSVVLSSIQISGQASVLVSSGVEFKLTTTTVAEQGELRVENGSISSFFIILQDNSAFVQIGGELQSQQIKATQNSTMDINGIQFTYNQSSFTVPNLICVDCNFTNISVFSSNTVISGLFISENLQAMGGNVIVIYADFRSPFSNFSEISFTNSTVNIPNEQITVPSQSIVNLYNTNMEVNVLFVGWQAYEMNVTTMPKFNLTLNSSTIAASIVLGADLSVSGQSSLWINSPVFDIFSQNYSMITSYTQTDIADITSFFNLTLTNASTMWIINTSPSSSCFMRAYLQIQQQSKYGIAGQWTLLNPLNSTSSSSSSVPMISGKGDIYLYRFGNLNSTLIFDTDFAYNITLHLSVSTLIAPSVALPTRIKIEAPEVDSELYSVINSNNVSAQLTCYGGLAVIGNLYVTNRLTWSIQFPEIIVINGTTHLQGLLFIQDYLYNYQGLAATGNFLVLNSGDAYNSSLTGGFNSGLVPVWTNMGLNDYRYNLVYSGGRVYVSYTEIPITKPFWRWWMGLVIGAVAGTLFVVGKEIYSKCSRSKG
eukprot:TRINITY_DN5552_c0_g1_i1.p1 TRINITY_DN5552_c0_g1~~TRINITY_DN5552_c0_g1_i1.p1  ORF type:complete len:645 (-),score=134.55 TRINITY_DN5552_c0_g1_i1:1-1866(-)